MNFFSITIYLYRRIQPIHKGREREKERKKGDYDRAGMIGKKTEHIIAQKIKIGGRVSKTEDVYRAGMGKRGKKTRTYTKIDENGRMCFGKNKRLDSLISIGI